jgi:hypothetical protein
MNNMQSFFHNHTNYFQNHVNLNKIFTKLQFWSPGDCTQVVESLSQDFSTPLTPQNSLRYDGWLSVLRAHLCKRPNQLW